MSRVTDSFKNQTGYDIEAFIVDFQNFLVNDYNNIVSYYEGGDIVSSSFTNLSYLNKELGVLLPLFDFIDSKTATLDMWQLLDVISDIQTKLGVVNNMVKWKRSSFDGKQQNKTTSQRILLSNQSFEMVASDNGYTNPQDDWVDILVNNSLTEEDYNVSGVLPSGSGILYDLKLLQDREQNPTVVIDSMGGQNAKGKDISAVFYFEDNDLATVTANDALTQSANIILETTQGDIPENRLIGLPSILVGSNVSSIQYPLIIRGLIEMFSTDDRWQNFEVTKITKKEDSLFFDFNFSSIFSDYNIKITKSL